MCEVLFSFYFIFYHGVKCYYYKKCYYHHPEFCLTCKLLWIYDNGGEIIISCLILSTHGGGKRHLGLHCKIHKCYKVEEEDC